MACLRNVKGPDLDANDSGAGFEVSDQRIKPVPLGNGLSWAWWVIRLLHPGYDNLPARALSASCFTC